MKIDSRLQEISDCLYRLSVKALIVRDGKVLLTIEDEDDFWSLPGGGIDYGETAQEALVREISEEIGVAQDMLSVVDDVATILIGLPIDGVPRANLVYHVKIADNVDPAVSGSLLMSQWFWPSEIANLHTSPPTGTAAQLAQLIETEIEKMNNKVLNI